MCNIIIISLVMVANYVFIIEEPRSCIEKAQWLIVLCPLRIHIDRGLSWKKECLWDYKQKISNRVRGKENKLRSIVEVKEYCEGLKPKAFIKTK